jgi:hypothetical protein
MERLILTTSDSGAGSLLGAKLADCVIPLGLRFVWGQLPSQIELEALLSSRSAMASHWLDHTGARLQEVRTEGPGLIEFCGRFEKVELWVDPEPNAQLMLIWLLDYLRHHPKTASKLTLVQADLPIGNHAPEELARWRLPSVKIQSEHLEAASKAWLAYRQPTPHAWSNLLHEDLDLLPQLRQSVLELLEELPMPATGLGATEMRILKLISLDVAGPSDVFPGTKSPINGACSTTGRSESYWTHSFIVRRRL